MDTFEPDWKEVWTPQEAEEQLKRSDYFKGGFKFNGPGWYRSKDDTMLVIPVSRLLGETWHQRMKKNHDPNEKFVFYVYNGRNPAAVFGEIFGAPTRTDEEDE